MIGKRSADGLWFEEFGAGSDVLLLVHGMGANGAVWDPFLAIAADQWNGRLVIPDLRGHGRSSHHSNYSFGTMASDLAGLVQPGDIVSIIGHSLGGALGAFLGTGWFGIDVARVLALSVKVKWTDEEIQKGRSVAQSAVRWMPTREEALDRYLRVSGLAGRDRSTARSAEVGIVEEGGQYRLALDNGAFGSAAPGVVGMMRQCMAPLAFLTGETDPIAPPSDFAETGLDVAVVDGAGHQLPVDAPEAVWQAFSGQLGRGGQQAAG
ncbi:alpha/beta fold hydrolase [Sphingomonas oryzagri]